MLDIDKADPHDDPDCVGGRSTHVETCVYGANFDSSASNVGREKIAVSISYSHSVIFVNVCGMDRAVLQVPYTIDPSI